MRSEWEDLPSYSIGEERTMLDPLIRCVKCESREYTVQFIRRGYEPVRQAHSDPADVMELRCADCKYKWFMRPADGIGWSL